MDFLRGAFVLLLLGGALQADEAEAKKAFAEKDYKKAVNAYQAAIESAAVTEQPRLKIALAKVYIKDQNQEKALALFLEAIDQMPTLPESHPSEQEKALYERVLNIYLAQGGVGSSETAKAIKREFATSLVEHPDYYLLSFLFAAADANLGQYEQFFDLFARSYPHYPDHYLVYKTKAILEIKLFERARNPSEREVHQKQIRKLLNQAMERNPHDMSLYKVMIAYGSDAERPTIVKENLNQIIERNMIVPRADIPFFVQNAAEVKQFELAQRFLEKAKEWYPVSRVIDTAQQYLERKMKQ